MRSQARIAAVLALPFLLGLTTSARADGTLFPGTRPLGTGGAMRAVATGDAGPMLNPSGISLVRSYIADGSYQYDRQGKAHDGHVSVVDSTSGLNLGGALFYTFHVGWPDSGSKESGHVGGGSLSFPIGDVVHLGGTVKYLRLATEFDDPAREKQSVRRFSFDAGITVRAGHMLSVGLVGYNLSDPGTHMEPLALGGGVSVSPIPNLLILADAVLEKGHDAGGPEKPLHLMGGGELSLGKGAAVRLGGGRDGRAECGYVSGGISAVSEIGALDLSLRQDVSGTHKSTIVGASARLFVPNP